MIERGLRIALFSPFFFPEPISTGKANTHLAEALRDDGCEVTVICSHPLYPTWMPTVSCETPPQIKVHRGGGWLKYPNNATLRRVMLEVWFSGHVAFSLIRHRNRFDVAILVVPPSLFGLVAHVALPSRTRRVALIHDLQSVHAATAGLLGSALAQAIKSVERRVLRACDRCVFFSADMAYEATRQYALSDAAVRVQYPFVTLQPSDAGRKLHAVLPWGQRHVVYSGALGKKQYPEKLMEYLRYAAGRLPAVQFHVFSAGPVFNDLRREYDQVSGMNFHDLVEEEDLPELYARSTVQLIPQAPGTETGSLPSKLPNLIAAGTRIVAICSASSEVAKLLRRAQTGTVVEEWDRDMFFDRLERALQDCDSESHAMRRERAAPLLHDFDVANLARLASHDLP